jgi:hypothetical protein
MTNTPDKGATNAAIPANPTPGRRDVADVRAILIVIGVSGSGKTTIPAITLFVLHVRAISLPPIWHCQCTDCCPVFVDVISAAIFVSQSIAPGVVCQSKPHSST